MVELVDHDHVEVIGCEPVESPRVQGLHAGEHVRPALRDLTAVEGLAEVRTYQDVL